MSTELTKEVMSEKKSEIQYYPVKIKLFKMESDKFSHLKSWNHKMFLDENDLQKVVN